MESVRVSYIFWLRTKSHGCIHYNGNGALNVMETKTRTTAERLSASQKWHFFQVLVGNGEYQWSWRYCQNPRIFLSDVQSPGCSTAYDNTGSCGTIWRHLHAHVHSSDVCHTVCSQILWVTRSEAWRSVGRATKGLETLHVCKRRDCLHHFHRCTI